MMKKGILIGIAGGTGSGKTSVARAITQDFPKADVALIEQDYYYHDLSHIPLEDRKKVNYDHPESLDFPLLKKHMSRLLAGQAVDISLYDYAEHTRSKTETVSFNGHHIIILEGIMALYDEEIRNLMDIKIYVDTADDIRITRRIKRDLTERGRTLDSVLSQYYTTVRPMHQQFVEPTKRFADIIVPEGGNNLVAIDLLKTKIKSLLNQKTGAAA